MDAKDLLEERGAAFGWGIGLYKQPLKSRRRTEEGNRNYYYFLYY